MITARWFGCLVALSLSATALADDGRAYAVDAARSTLGYTIVHKLKEASATSRRVEGKLQLGADGRLRVAIRAPVASFDSGNSSRDAHMQETTEAAKFPYVSFRGAGQIALPQTYPATVRTSVAGELDFHGRKKTEIFNVELIFASATEVRARGRFDVSLDAYQVERPSLLLMKIDDRCQIEADLQLREGR